MRIKEGKIKQDIKKTNLFILNEKYRMNSNYESLNKLRIITIGLGFWIVILKDGLKK
jgi:hypothetical protein